MPEIREAQETVIDFFTSEMGKDRDAVRFIKLLRVGEGWEAKVEVTELNTYMKKLGFPMIMDKNIYTVTLGGDFKVTGFALSSSQERSYATEDREEL